MTNSGIPQYRGAGQGPSTAVPDQPAPVRFARLKTVTVWIFVLHVASWAWGLILTLTGVTTEMAIREIRNTPGTESLSDSTIRRQAEMAEWFGVAFGVIALAIAVTVFLLVFLGLRRRANWARVLGIVLAFVVLGLGLLEIVLFFVQPIDMTWVTIVGWLLTLPMLAAAAYWLVLAFHREVREYLAPRWRA